MQEKTRVDMIHETIRDRICVGTYKRGDVLHEGELGLEFEVSRTPIRQVLQRLAYEKMVMVRPGVGTIVGGLGQGDIEKCLQIRSRILTTIAELRLVIPDPDMDPFDTLMVRALRLGDQPEPDRAWAMARDLHLFCNRLINDDLLRHVDDMLFYRTAPSLVEGIRQEPTANATLLREELAELAPLTRSPDMSALFAARARRLQRYGELPAAAAG